MTTFNPYLTWLGISSEQPDHYQLLSVDASAGADEIARAADSATNRLRSVRPGEHAAKWAALLDELQAAKSTLLDPAKRSVYDQQRHSASQAVAPAPVAGAPAPTIGATQADAESAIEMQVEVSQPGGAEISSKYPPGFAPPGAAPAPVPAAPVPATPIAAAPPSQTPPPPTTPTTQNPMAAAPSVAQPLTSQATPAPVAMTPAATPVAQPAAPAMPLAGTPLPPTGSIPPGQPSAAPTPVGQPLAQQPLGYQPVPMGQPVAQPAPPNVAQPVAASAGQGQPPAQPLAAPAGQSPDVGRKPSASKEANRRRKQAWAAPIAIFIGLFMLGILAGALYLGIRGRGGDEVADADGVVTADNPDSGADQQVIPNDQSDASQAGATGDTGNSADSSQSAGQTTAQSNAAQSSTGQTSNGQSSSGQATAGQTTAAGSAEQTGQTRPAGDNVNPGAQRVPGVGAVVVGEGTPAAPKTNTETTGSGAATGGSQGADSPGGDGDSSNGGGAGDAGNDGGNAAGDSSSGAKPNAANPDAKNKDKADASTTKPPTKKEIADFREAMIAAYDATSLHNFAEANQQLVKAKKLAKTDEHKEMAERLSEVADYVRQFRAALEAGIADLNGGTVFQVGSYTVALIEKGPNHVSIRVSGFNRRYKFNDMPGNTGLAFSDFVLDQSAASTKVIKGAYLLVHPRVDEKQLAKARQLWKEAKESGADIEHLLPALDDDYAAIK